MISHAHNTLFVHIPKTAGQSIEHVFLAALGLQWKDRAALLLRPNTDRPAGPERLAHLLAREYVACGHVTPERFGALFRFAVVRHPYDRFLSEYRFRRKTAETTVDAMLDDIAGDPFTDATRHVMPQSDYLLDTDGRLLVDEVVRFEELSEQIRPIFQRIFGHVPDLPVVNQTSSSPADASLLDDALRRRLHRAYARDFDMFGYSSGFAAGS